jgi:hypothetical protein
MKVALERIKEYSELQVEPPEFVEPRPPASWPTKGEIVCEDLVIRYAVGSKMDIHVPVSFSATSPNFLMCYTIWISP